MRDDTVIDKIYGGLLRLCSNGDFNFEKFKGSWGYKTSDGYMDKKLDFIEKIRMLAKDCDIKFYDGSFYMYDDKIYVAIREELIITAYNLLIEHLRIVPMLGDKQTCKQYFIDIIRYFNPLLPRHDLIAFKNGVLDLREYKFYDFNPRFHVTYYHPYEYNPNAKCNKWRSFLHEVLPDKNSRVILQMFLGLGLMERGTVYNPYEGKNAAKVELCLILLGAGANGKSTIYDTAVGIFGKERISGLDYDDLTATGDEGMRARRLLREAIFNWSSDSDQRTFGRKRTGVFKRIVSGESVTDRRLGEDVKENYHIPFLIFNLNELPYSDDQSLGFIRRLQFISFEYSIPKEKQNPALSRELVAEYPGIFNWILKGSRELKRCKFVFPSSEGNRRQILLAQLQMNPVIAWINSYQMRKEAHAVHEEYVYIQTSEMLKSLEQFCKDNNVEVPSKQKFGHTMSRQGFAKKHFPEGFRYIVYGCNESRLRLPFVIENEDMHVDYIKEKGSFIEEDD